MKRRRMQGMIAVVMAVGGLSVAGSVAAQPSPPIQNFGHHVSSCAQNMGFDGTMNPGRMHHGAAGWVPGSACER